jgi:type IV secretion system protein TrbG
VAVAPPVDESEFIAADSPEVQEAFARYQRTGKAPVIRKKESQFVVWPYGLSQPIMYCHILEICNVQLDTDEEYLSFANGDAARWEFGDAKHGPVEKRYLDFWAKPLDDVPNMTTSITVYTSKRIYFLKFISRTQAPTIHGQFYFPKEMAQQMRGTRHDEQHPTPAPPVDMAAIAATRSQYEIEGDEELYPSLVGNDGTRTFFLMPTSLHTRNAPVLFEISPSGKRTQINYRLVDGYYSADKLLEKAVLVWGVGSDERSVTITRTVG